MKLVIKDASLNPITVAPVFFHNCPNANYNLTST